MRLLTRGNAFPIVDLQWVLLCGVRRTAGVLLYELFDSAWTDA